jgi:hypothetical protein
MCMLLPSNLLICKHLFMLHGTLSDTGSYSHIIIIFSVITILSFKDTSVRVIFVSVV